MADDDYSQRLLLAALVRRMGHEVHLAADGEEAFAMLLSTGADLLICDIHMPQATGLEVAHRIRAHPFDHYIYILLVTGSSGSSGYVAGLEAGADDFMPKPVNPEFLTTRVRAAGRILGYDMQLREKTRLLEIAYREMESDLVLAGNAQLSMLPSQETVLSGIRANSVFLPSRFVSGDMFNYFALDSHRIGFFAADVSGHGIRAALLGVTLGHILTPEYFCHVDPSSDWRDASVPERLARQLNRTLANREDDTYFTLFCGVVNTNDNSIDFCQAGHPHPLLLTSHGYQWVGSGGMPLGCFANPEIMAGSIAFNSGDRIIIHSDGITEAESPTGELYGEARFLHFMLDSRASSPADLCTDFVITLHRWTESELFDDDVSMLVLDRT